MASRVFTSDTKKDDVIGADSLRFTTAAGMASLFAAVVGAAIPVLDKITSLSVSENLKIAMLGLVGAGVLGYAIASAGDALARAYATAHVRPAKETTSGETTTTTKPAPAVQYVVDQLVKRLDEIKPDVKAALSAPAHRPTIVPLPNAIHVKTRMHDDCDVVAMFFNDGGKPEDVRFLVARKGAALELKTQADIEPV